MQSSFLDASSHPYVYGLLLFLAGLLGPRGIAWVQLYLNRRKPKADIHLSEAQTRHTDAESIQITANTVATMVEQLQATNQLMLNQSKELVALRQEVEELRPHKAARLLLEQELDSIKQKARTQAGLKEENS